MAVTTISQFDALPLSAVPDAAQSFVFPIDATVGGSLGTYKMDLSQLRNFILNSTRTHAVSGASSTSSNLLVAGGSNVGIGTVTPRAPLEVDGDVIFTGALTAQGDLQGLALRATNLEHVRLFKVIGDVVSSSVGFNGGSDVNLITVLQANKVITATIKDLNVTTAKIADGAITSAKISNDQVRAGHIAAGHVRSAHIENDSVKTAKIANYNVTGVKIANGAITNEKLQSNIIASTNLQTGIIQNKHLTSNCIAGGNIPTGTITNTHILGSTIDASLKLANASITTEKLANEVVDNTKIAINTIASNKLATITGLTEGTYDENPVFTINNKGQITSIADRTASMMISGGTFTGPITLPPHAAGGIQFDEIQNGAEDYASITWNATNEVHSLVMSVTGEGDSTVWADASANDDNITFEVPNLSGVRVKTPTGTYPVWHMGHVPNILAQVQQYNDNYFYTHFRAGRTIYIAKFNSTAEVLADGWVERNCTIDYENYTGSTQFKIIANGLEQYHRATNDVSDVVAGKKYKVTAQVFVPEGAPNVKGFQFRHANGTSGPIIHPTLDTWYDFSYEYTAIDNSDYDGWIEFWLANDSTVDTADTFDWAGAPANADYMYVKNVVLTELHAVDAASSEDDNTLTLLGSHVNSALGYTAAPNTRQHITDTLGGQPILAKPSTSNNANSWQRVAYFGVDQDLQVYGRTYTWQDMYVGITSNWGDNIHIAPRGHGIGANEESFISLNAGNEQVILGGPNVGLTGPHHLNLVAEKTSVRLKAKSDYIYHHAHRHIFLDHHDRHLVKIHRLSSGGGAMHIGPEFGSGWQDTRQYRLHIWSREHEGLVISRDGSSQAAMMGVFDSKVTFGGLGKNDSIICIEPDAARHPHAKALYFEKNNISLRAADGVYIQHPDDHSRFARLLVRTGDHNFRIISSTGQHNARTILDYTKNGHLHLGNYENSSLINLIYQSGSKGRVGIGTTNTQPSGSHMHPARLTVQASHDGSNSASIYCKNAQGTGGLYLQHQWVHRSGKWSAISNDITGYKTMMIVGNTTGGGARKVSVWDWLTVGSQNVLSMSDPKLSVHGDARISKKLRVDGEIECKSLAYIGGGDATNWTCKIHWATSGHQHTNNRGIFINGKQIDVRCGRGVNVYILTPTGEIRHYDYFDVWADRTRWNNYVEWIQDVAQQGDVVVSSIQDVARRLSNNWRAGRSSMTSMGDHRDGTYPVAYPTEFATEFFTRLGAHQIFKMRDYRYGGAWAFIYDSRITAEWKGRNWTTVSAQAGYTPGNMTREYHFTRRPYPGIKDDSPIGVQSDSILEQGSYSGGATSGDNSGQSKAGKHHYWEEEDGQEFCLIEKFSPYSAGAGHILFNYETLLAMGGQTAYETYPNGAKDAKTTPQKMSVSFNNVKANSIVKTGTDMNDYCYPPAGDAMVFENIYMGYGGNKSLEDDRGWAYNKGPGAFYWRDHSSSWDDWSYSYGRRRSHTWYERHMLRIGWNNQGGHYGGLRIRIPDGVDTLWVQTHDCWSHYQLYYLYPDSYGKWRHGTPPNMPGPSGYAGPGSHWSNLRGKGRHPRHGYRKRSGKWGDAGIHNYGQGYAPNRSGTHGAGRHWAGRWVAIPLDRALLRDFPYVTLAAVNQNCDPWVMGLAFGRNPWNHACNHAVNYHWQLNGGDYQWWSGWWWYRNWCFNHSWHNQYNIRVPCIFNGKDKVLYANTHNWGGIGSGGAGMNIRVNGISLDGFENTFSNPFAARGQNSSHVGSGYMGVVVPYEVINNRYRDGAGWSQAGHRGNVGYIDVDLMGGYTDYHFYYSEMGTHDYYPDPYLISTNYHASNTRSNLDGTWGRGHNSYSGSAMRWRGD